MIDLLSVAWYVLKNGDDTIIPDAPTKAQTARRGNRNELRDGLGQGRDNHEKSCGVSELSTTTLDELKLDALSPQR